MTGVNSYSSKSTVFFITDVPLSMSLVSKREQYINKKTCYKENGTDPYVNCKL